MISTAEGEEMLLWDWLPFLRRSPAVRESCEAEENTSDADPSSHDGGCCSSKANIWRVNEKENNFKRSQFNE